MTNEAINIIARAIALEDGSYLWRDYLPMARAAFIAIREHDLAGSSTEKQATTKQGDEA